VRGGEFGDQPGAGFTLPPQPLVHQGDDGGDPRAQDRPDHRGRVELTAMLTEGLMVAAVSTRTAGTPNRSGVGWHREPQRRQLQVQQHHRVHTDTPATAWSFSVTQRPAPTSNRTTNSTCMSLGGEVQADDVVATHAAIRARGGSPSDIERVNWIKMQMFEIRDPDGNVLWFGQSYHKDQDSPSRRDGQPQGLRQALPALPFDNVPVAVAYYRDVLGFHINYQQADLGVMDRDAITVLLIARTTEHKGIGSFEIYVSDADALYEEFSAKGASILGPPVSRPWGLRDFTLIDVEGNRITFAQPFE